MNIRELSKMSKPYNYIRWRWWQGIDLDKIAPELEKDFKVEKIEPPAKGDEISLYKDEREELRVKADTLQAILSAFRGVLNQDEAAPFTQKDLKLREKVIQLYNHERPTPFPWEFSHEPKFEVAKS